MRSKYFRRYKTRPSRKQPALCARTDCERRRHSVPLEAVSPPYPLNGQYIAPNHPTDAEPLLDSGRPTAHPHQSRGISTEAAINSYSLAVVIRTETVKGTQLCCSECRSACYISGALIAANFCDASSVSPFSLCRCSQPGAVLANGGNSDYDVHTAVSRLCRPPGRTPCQGGPSVQEQQPATVSTCSSSQDGTSERYAAVPQCCMLSAE